MSHHARRLCRTVAIIALLGLTGASAIATPAVSASAASAAAAAALVGHWTFDEGSGATAADSAGSHNATLLGGAGWGRGVQGPSALATNGFSAYADTGAAILDTAGSFSVSAWARFDRLGGYQTVVSIDGSRVSNFYLQLRGDSGRFAFVRLPVDQSVGAPAYPSATFDPSAGQWYLLTGVYDAVASTLSLYVNGRLQGVTPAPAPWAPTGHLVIGRGLFGGNHVDWVRGAIDDVRVYSGALTTSDVARLATFGSWRLDEGSGVNAADSSLYHHDATLAGGATWTTGVVGAHAVLLDGTSGVVNAPAGVVDPTLGFSVAAWARADTAPGERTIVSLDGSQASAFALLRRSDGRFAFSRAAADDPSAPIASAASSAAALPGQWYQLTGVYDGVAGTLTLYVDGTAQQTVPFTTPWPAAGRLVIGRGLAASSPAAYFSGAINDVRTYPFPLHADDAQLLAVSGLWNFDEGSGTVANDSSPDNAPGTLRGATWTAGASGTAVAFDGRSDVTMGDVPALNLGTGSFSLAAWFRTPSRGVQPIVDKGAYRLGIDGGRVTARLGTGRGRIEVASAQRSFADDQWHHAAVTLDRGAQALVLFVDGRPVPIVAARGACGVVTGAALDVSRCPASGDSAQPFTVGSTGGQAPRLIGAVDELEILHFPLAAAQVMALAGANDLTVNAADIGAATHPSQYSGMLEDISHSVEGGLYAELVRNRTFEESYQRGSGPGAGPVPYWSLVASGGALGSIGIDTATPLNSAIDRSLDVHVDSLPAGATIGVANVGYYGVPVTPSTTYTGSLWARATPGFTGSARVSLVSAQGAVLASAPIGRLGTSWAQHAYRLRTSDDIVASTSNQVVVTLENGPSAGQDVWLSVVSLFPPTYLGRLNGLRPDIMSKLAAMHLGLLRVPGGNYLEGSTLDTRFNWKNTIGPISERPGHQNTAWGYWSSDGMGLLEYLQMAEDLGAQPLLAVFAGYTLNGQHVAQADFAPYVQDALDEIEYATGPATSPWGARRAADGHPEPFALTFVEIGNEDGFDRSGSYEWRFAAMYDAIKAKYPQLQVVATTPVRSRTPDVLDDHFYQPPSWFASHSTLYDNTSRSGPRILVGEYGAQQGGPTGALAAAVGEAAFLTGLERNSDLIVGGMYAPMLVNENQPNWPVNMMGIDAAHSYGSPSYWVQRMFSTALGANLVGSAVTAGSPLREDVTVTRDDERATYYIKVVNPSPQLESAVITFAGADETDGPVTATVLTGSPSARNSLAAPLTIRPVTTRLGELRSGERFVFPASSVTVLKVSGS